MITPAQLRARFPGPFDSMSDDTIQLVIDEAAATIREDVWGSDYDTGLLHLTAHKLTRTVTTSGGGGFGGTPVGLVKRRKADGLEVEFSESQRSSSGGSENLSSTPYGEDYLILRKAHQGGPVVPHDRYT